MFELCYFSSNELVPAGWQAVDEDKNFPRISSRAPQQSEDSGYDHDMTNGRAASESSNEDDSFSHGNYSSITRMNDDDEESDEDELAPAPVVSRVSPGPCFFFYVQPKHRFPYHSFFPPIVLT